MMKKHNLRFLNVIKDGLIGFFIGLSMLIPGISGATIAFIFNVFKKIVNAISHLFSKQFFKNFLILLPFGVGLILAVVLLIKPFQLAFEHCLFAFLCLFAAFILGSLPSLFRKIKGQEVTSNRIFVFIISLLLAIGIGILSINFNLSNEVNNLFLNKPWYLYLILFLVGFVASTGITVPGLSGSMILLVIGFYKPIINVIKIDFLVNNTLQFFLILGVFALGVIGGLILFSKLMSFTLKKYEVCINYMVLGLVIGSLFSLFMNNELLDYLQSIVTSKKNLDFVLAPIFILVGIGLAFLLDNLTSKRKDSLKSANNDDIDNNIETPSQNN